MKKVMQMVAVVAMTLTPLALGGTALAVSTCQVGYTGPNSNNLCVSTTKYACNAVNNTTVNVQNGNVQVAVSGDASGGSASTGSATNSNGVTFTATVENRVCTVVATVPATVTPPPVHTTEKTPTPVVAPQKVTATALPNTASSSPLAVIGWTVGAFGVGAILVRLAMSFLNRAKL